jgi:O-antigen ligase
MNKLPNHLSKSWINFLVFVFSISVLSITGHGGEAAIMLLITSIYVSITNTRDGAKYKLNKSEIIFITLVLLFWLLNLLNTIFQPDGLEYENIKLAFRAMDNPMRWLLMLPIFFLFRRFTLDWRFIAIGLSIGVFISVGIAVNEIYFLGVERATGGVNHYITFGELMVAVDILLWIFMVFAWSNHKFLRSFFFIASLVAFYGSLLSVTRGAWIVYIFIILSFTILSLKKSLFQNNKFFNKGLIMRVLMSFLVFFLVSKTDQFNLIQKRTVDTVSEIINGEVNNASGGRINLYFGAMKIAQHFPLGIGTDNFRNGSKYLILIDAQENKSVVVKNQNNDILNINNIKGIHEHHFLRSYNHDGSLRFTSEFRHAHNEWLNVLAENGVAGFILLTLLFGFPFKIFWQNLNHKNNLVSMYSYCGISLISSFFVFGQTQSVFTSHVAVIFFIFFLFLFFSQVSRLISIDAHKKALINS